MVKIYRILIIGMTHEIGGRETFVMELYRRIDRNKIQFDFINNEPEVPLAFEEEIHALGGTVFRIPKARNSPWKHLAAIVRVFQKQQYFAVYYHANDMILNADIFTVAKNHHVPLRILHSHNSSNWGEESAAARILQRIAVVEGKRSITHRLSCSQAAGEWMFGKDAVFQVVDNGIDTLKFDFSPTLRQEVRAREKVEGKTVYGTVGRIAEVKNPLFLVDVFKAIHDRQPGSVFWHVGGGPLEARVKEKIRSLGLEDSFLLLGRQERVADYLNGMDLFLLPSVFEGFPLTLVEAQDCGLDCLVSDSVTTDVNLTGKIRYLPITETAESWAETAIAMADGAGERASCREVLTEKGYDVEETAKWFQKLILENDYIGVNRNQIYFVGSKRLDLRHAGGKAPNDIYTLCELRGWQELHYPGIRFHKPEQLYRAIRGFLVWFFWVRAGLKLKPGDIVFYQHPVRYGSKIALPHIKKLQKRGVRFIALVHDLDSLRFRLLYTEDSKTNVYFEDGPFLKQFDVIICHNDRMKQYLTEQGIPEEKLICLQLFDYLQDSRHSQLKEPSDALVVAGNFTKKKCGYIYELTKKNLQIPIYLYGINFDREEGENENTCYFGSYDPDELPSIMRGKYGVVWDGIGIETCEGATGEYLRYNNPHKLSSYIAAELPVIIWTEAAAAEFVKENGVGITVDSLCDLESRLAQVSEQEYDSMKAQVMKLRKDVIRGAFFNRAVDAALQICDTLRQ